MVSLRREGLVTFGRIVREHRTILLGAGVQDSIQKIMVRVEATRNRLSLADLVPSFAGV